MPQNYAPSVCLLLFAAACGIFHDPVDIHQVDAFGRGFAYGVSTWTLYLTFVFEHLKCQQSFARRPTSEVQFSPVKNAAVDEDSFASDAVYRCYTARILWPWPDRSVSDLSSNTVWKYRKTYSRSLPLFIFVEIGLDWLNAEVQIRDPPVGVQPDLNSQGHAQLYFAANSSLMI